TRALFAVRPPGCGAIGTRIRPAARAPADQGAAPGRCTPPHPATRHPAAKPQLTAARKSSAHNSRITLNTGGWEGSQVQLRSGMALQIDIIPATGTAYHTTNIEDGIALADEPTRVELAARYPDLWRRVSMRRAFMADVLGIQLKPEVLPLSNLAGYLPPFWLSPGLAMRRC